MSAAARIAANPLADRASAGTAADRAVHWGLRSHRRTVTAISIRHHPGIHRSRRHSALRHHSRRHSTRSHSTWRHSACGHHSRGRAVHCRLRTHSHHALRHHALRRHTGRHHPWRGHHSLRRHHRRASRRKRHRAWSRPARIGALSFNLTDGNECRRQGKDRQYGQGPRPSYLHRKISAAPKSCQEAVPPGTCLALLPLPATTPRAVKGSAISLDRTYRRGITVKINTSATNGNFSRIGRGTVDCRVSVNTLLSLNSSKSVASLTFHGQNQGGVLAVRHGKHARRG